MANSSSNIQRITRQMRMRKFHLIRKTKAKPWENRLYVCSFICFIITAHIHKHSHILMHTIIYLSTCSKLHSLKQHLYHCFIRAHQNTKDDNSLFVCLPTSFYRHTHTHTHHNDTTIQHQNF